MQGQEVACLLALDVPGLHLQLFLLVLSLFEELLTIPLFKRGVVSIAVNKNKGNQYTSIS